MCVIGDIAGYLDQVLVHGMGVAPRHDESGSLALFGADGTEDISRPSSLVVWRGRPCSPLGPAAGDLVLLAYTSFVLKPDFEHFAQAGPATIFATAAGKFFKSLSRFGILSMMSWASRELAIPMARTSRPSVSWLTEMRNSSRIHCARSHRRQRTTPSRYGVGPRSIACAKAARCSSFRREGLPEALPLIRPSGPRSMQAPEAVALYWHPVYGEPDAANWPRRNPTALKALNPSQTSCLQQRLRFVGCLWEPSDAVAGCRVLAEIVRTLAYG